MNESLKNEESVREYLLGRVSDETSLAEFEDRLFLDEEFSSLAELVEDGLINDFVFGKLNNKDADDFAATLENSRERREKVAFTQSIKEKAAAVAVAKKTSKPSFFDSVAAFFRKPLNVGAFALVLIGISAAWFLLINRNNASDLAELKSIYQKDRPTESRISGFDFAPLTATRGADEEREKNKLRRIENALLDAVENDATAQEHHALGVFYLTQRKYSEAVTELETAAKLDAGNSSIRNDLGSAYYEFAKSGPKEKRLENLARANELFSKSLDLDGNQTEALFNKAIALQELNLPRQAKETWEKYLEKDPNSKWADEARKYLEKISGLQSVFRSKQEVLNDFLTAYRKMDEPRALQIHHETKGFLNEISLPLQLSRKFLEAKKKRDAAEAEESLAAIDFIGGFEKEKHADFFVSEIAEYYKNTRVEKADELLAAKDRFEIAHSLYRKLKYGEAIREFEASRDTFRTLGNQAEASVAEIWAAQFLPDVFRLDESRKRLHALIDDADKKNFKVILPTAYYWLAISDIRQNKLSESIRKTRIALEKAEETDNFLEIDHCAESLADNYAYVGEYDKALTFINWTARPGVYAQSKTQYWRDIGTFTNVAAGFGFLATASDAAKEMVLIAKEVMPDGNLINSSLGKLAGILMENKAFHESLDAAGSSLQIALNREESETNNLTIGETYLLTGDIRREMDECGAALAAYDKSLEFYDKISEFTARLYSVHKGKLLCLNRLNRQAEFETELERVLKFSEQNRREIREDDLRQAFFDQQQEMYDAVIANALDKSDSRRAFEVAEISKARSLLDFVQTTKSIADVEKDYKNVSMPLELAEIQARIPDNCQVVQYSVLPDKLAIWSFTKDRFEVVEKPISADAFEKTILDYQRAIVEKSGRNVLETAAKELYSLLLPPGLDPNKTLVLIPDKLLFGLPFASLISGANRYLIEDFPIVYSASSSVFVAATENGKVKASVKSEALLAVGNPAFDRTENPELADLPDAETEVREISADFPKTSTLVGTTATRTHFLGEIENANVIHFAGHFVANQRFPGNSKLVFSDDDLRASELAEIKIPHAKLVVLSACETGFERFNRSEGAIGIARTFLAMGAPIVVASGWKVDSAASKDLMIAFHQNRTHKGLSSIDALREAQLAMLQSSDFSAPYYWSAFSVAGGFVTF